MRLPGKNHAAVGIASHKLRVLTVRSASREHLHPSSDAEVAERKNKWGARSATLLPFTVASFLVSGGGVTKLLYFLSDFLPSTRSFLPSFLSGVPPYLPSVMLCSSLHLLATL